MKDGFPVSVAELLAAGERPLPSEAVAIVLDLCAQVMRRPSSASVLPAISTGGVFIDGGGSVTIAGGVPVEDEQTVLLLGRLLLQLLPQPGTPAFGQAPARLRHLAHRAASGELPRMSVSRFAAGLRRFGPEQARLAVRGVFERWRSGGFRRPLEHSRESTDGSRPIWAQAMSEAAPPETGITQVPPPAANGLRRHRGRLAVALVILLLLMGAGAAYWLNADERLPPLPLTPAGFRSAPPQRNGWELLARPATLAAEGQTRAPEDLSSEAGSQTAADAEHRDAPPTSGPGGRALSAARITHPAGDAGRAR